MFRILLRREVLGHLLEFRYSLYFIITCLLIISSFYVSVLVYRVKYDHHQEMAGVLTPNPAIHHNYPVLDYYHLASNGICTSVKPEKLQVFCQGLDTYLSTYVSAGINLRSSRLPLARREPQDNPLPALLPHLDMSFIVGFILSLFVFILSHNAVTREREQGTLRMVFANPVDRARVILAKFLGGYLGVAFPFLVAVLACLLISFVLPGFLLTGTEILALGVITLYSLLYLLVLYFLGILVSVRCRRSRSAMAVLMLIWLFFAVVIHNAGLMVIQAGSPVSVRTTITDHRRALQELEAEIDKKNGVLWEVYRSDGNGRAFAEEQKRMALYQISSVTERGQQAMLGYAEGLGREYRRLRILRILSPTLLYQSVISDITATGLRERIRLQESAARLLVWTKQYTIGKIKEQYRNGDTHWVTNENLPFKELAALDYKPLPLAVRVKDSLLSVLVLACYGVLLFVGAFYAFIRTDVG